MFKKIKIAWLLFVGLVSFVGITDARSKDPKFCATAPATELLETARLRSEQALKSNDLREKSRLATEGLFFADKCLAKDANNVGCIYYRGVNRGLDLETRTIGIKKDLGRMMSDFEKVLELDERYDDGGAYLALGYVYLKAPSLPILGDTARRDLTKAKDYALKSLKIAPANPENLKFAGEVAFQSKNFTEAEAYFNEALKISQKSSVQKFRDLEPELKRWLKKSQKKTAKKI